MIVADSKNIYAHSVILFFDFQIIEEGDDNVRVLFNQKTDVVLSATNLYLDTFKITAIKIYQDSPLMMLAI